MKNQNKVAYQSIPEVAVRRTRESQPYEKVKAAETPDKDTRGWIKAFTLIRDTVGEKPIEKISKRTRD